MKFLSEKSEVFSNNKNQIAQVIEDIKQFKENSIYPAIEKAESDAKNTLISFVAKNIFKILPEDLKSIDYSSFAELISDLLEKTVHSNSYSSGYVFNIKVQDIYDKVLYYIGKINPIVKKQINYSDTLYGAYLASNWDNWYNKNTKTLTIPYYIKYIKTNLKNDLWKADSNIYSIFLRKVEKLILPDDIEILSTDGFEFDHLKYIRLPSNLKIIKSDSLWTTYIPELIIPDNVSEIEKYAIKSYIGKITIPESLKFLGSNPFYLNKDSEILFKGTKKQWYALTENLTGQKTLFRKIVKYI